MRYTLGYSYTTFCDRTYVKANYNEKNGFCRFIYLSSTFLFDIFTTFELAKL